MLLKTAVEAVLILVGNDGAHLWVERWMVGQQLVVIRRCQNVNKSSVGGRQGHGCSSMLVGLHCLLVLSSFFFIRDHTNRGLIAYHIN